MQTLRALAAGAALAAAALAQAQQADPANGLFLVARPELVDPNFSRTVVLVTQAPDYSTVGVIINRPTTLRLAQFLGETFPAHRYQDPVYAGGPVMQRTIVALFQSAAPPQAPAFHVLKGLYLSTHPDNITRLLSSASARYRLYAGFSGWAPRQLEGEMLRAGWYVLPADEATIFRTDMGSLWDELVAKASGPRARLSPD